MIEESLEMISQKSIDLVQPIFSVLILCLRDKFNICLAQSIHGFANLQSPSIVNLQETILIPLLIFLPYLFL